MSKINYHDLDNGRMLHDEITEALERIPLGKESSLLKSIQARLRSRLRSYRTSLELSKEEESVLLDTVLSTKRPVDQTPEEAWELPPYRRDSQSRPLRLEDLGEEVVPYPTYLRNKN